MGYHTYRIQVIDLSAKEVWWTNNGSSENFLQGFVKGFKTVRQFNNSKTVLVGPEYFHNPEILAWVKRVAINNDTKSDIPEEEIMTKRRAKIRSTTTAWKSFCLRTSLSNLDVLDRIRGSVFSRRN